ncbi:hypothetical protein PSPTOT1_1065 [Pseudomonas syringae pv. tomato T1]|nr:hypothetical protein PSPTOT1_1065 [Pseudomonas syringae pv. tomato T1]
MLIVSRVVDPSCGHGAKVSEYGLVGNRGRGNELNVIHMEQVAIRTPRKLDKRVFLAVNQRFLDGA